MDTANSSPISSRNPGSFDQLHQKAQDVFPIAFEGAKISLQKGLSHCFQVQHTLSISPASTGYRFGATFVGPQIKGPNEAYPVLFGDTDAGGNTAATVVHQFGQRWRAKLQAQVAKGDIQAATASIERRGDVSTVGITLANTDIINDNGIFVAQYLRKLTERLDIGIEYMNNYGSRVPGGYFTLVSYAARYSAPKWTIAGSMSNSTTHLSYYHKETSNLAFGIEFNSNKLQGDATTTFAYQAELPEEGVTFRASIDTNWNVAGVLEKKLSPVLPFTLALSGLVNHQRSQGKFGFGLIIG